MEKNPAVVLAKDVLQYRRMLPLTTFCRTLPFWNYNSQNSVHRLNLKMHYFSRRLVIEALMDKLIYVVWKEDGTE